MKGAIAVFSAVGILLGAKVASAHRIDEYLQATLLSLKQSRVEGSMRLIPGVLVSPSIIAGIDHSNDMAISDAEAKAYAQRVLDDLSITVDGSNVRPVLASWTIPPLAHLRDGLGEIHIEYTVELPAGSRTRNLVLQNHHLTGSSVYLVNVLASPNRDVEILAQERNRAQSIFQLEFQNTRSTREAPSTRSILDQFCDSQLFHLFTLGMHHIAEGADHLLFLLSLLLPAPLLVSNRRWGNPASVRASLVKVLCIVTAFTIGHSVTLTLGALTAFPIPSRLVEVVVAMSILVSAAHAYRPMFHGREAVIASLFGLVHGLAFASALDRLGWDPWQRVTGILAFNVGVEAMQMLVIAAVLPSLILMSRTSAYPLLRVGGAVFAGVAAGAWLLERAFGVTTQIDLVLSALAGHALLMAAGLFFVAISCQFLPAARSQRTAKLQVQVP